MIPIIVPIITGSDRDHDGRRPNLFGALLSVIIMAIGVFLTFFLFLTGEFSSSIAIIGLLVLLITISLGLVIFTILGTSAGPQEFEREECYETKSPSKDYNRVNRNNEYCPECGALVEFSDSFCSTCGSRLDGWK